MVRTIFLLLFILLWTLVFYHLTPRNKPGKLITKYLYNNEKSKPNKFHTREELNSLRPDVDNEEFLQNFVMPSMQLNNTDAMEYQRNSVSWMPRSFGYSEEEGLLKFPPYQYPECKDVIETRGQSVALNTENDMISNNWNLKETQYITGPYKDYKLIYPGDVKFKVRKTTQRNINLPDDANVEYVLANWGEETFEYADMRPKYNEQAAKKAAKKINDEGKNYLTDEPVRIIHLTLDSYSRRHFFRKLPDTVRYLNELNTGMDYRVFDFKMHNIKGAQSIHNQLYTWSRTWPRIRDRISDSDTLGKHAIWNQLKKLGFMTLFGLESWNSNFAPTLGRGIKVDHSFNEFFCAAKEFSSKYDNAKTYIESQRWIGTKMSHIYALDYALEFIEMYKDLNQYIYIHLDAAHEATGQHAGTLDMDLPNYLEKIMTPNTLLFLEADHGMRYGDWYTGEEAHYEMKLPAFFIVAPTKILNEIRESYQNLYFNSFLLTSKYDIRKSILGMVQRMFKTPVDRSGGVDLFKKRIDPGRTCKDLGIVAWWWSCAEWYPVPSKQLQVNNAQKNKSNELGRLLNRIAKDAVNYVNEQIWMTTRKLWHQLTLSHIIQASAVAISKRTEAFKIDIAVENFEYASFEVLVQVGTLDHIIGNIHNSNPTVPVYYQGNKKVYKITYVKRNDKYSGVCEEFAMQRNIPSQYCICNTDYLDN